MTLSRFWTSLDQLPDASCARYDWKSRLGEAYAATEPLLKSTGKRADAVTCPHLSGDECPRRVTVTVTGAFRAFCENSPQQCDPLDLTKDDVIVLAPDRTVLKSRIGKALSLSGAKAPDPRTSVWHVGDRVAENGARVPVYFAIVGAQDAEKTSIFAPVIAGMQPSLLIVPTAFTLSVEQTGYLAKSSVTVRPADELLAVAKDGSFSATPLAARILGDLESKASDQISKAPRRAWQLPLGTEWSKVTISFVSEAAINVKCGKDVRRFEPDDLGMKDRRNGQPSSLWELLRLFAGSGGFLAHRKAQGRAKLERKKQLLCQRLNEALGMEGEPITVEPDGYHCQFIISAADLSQGRQGQVARNFGSTRD